MCILRSVWFDSALVSLVIHIYMYKALLTAAPVVASGRGSELLERLCCNPQEPPDAVAL